jgi:hypothetical protein
VDFQVNGRIMGTQMPYVKQRELAVTVTGWDQLDRVEILKNNRVLHRDFPMDRVPTKGSWDQPVLLRFEFGWGPGRPDMTRICDWDIEIRIEGGWLEDVQTVSGGTADETRRTESSRGPAQHGACNHSPRCVNSRTSLRKVVIKIRGNPETRVEVSATHHGVAVANVPATGRKRGNAVHRRLPEGTACCTALVFHDHYHTSYRLTDTDDTEG